MTLPAAPEPEAYRLGHIPFLDLTIDLSKRPLIPRVETEYWTALAIKAIKEKTAQNNLSAIRILDMFAGSGCIGLAVLRAIPEAIVDFAEIEPRFLAQIKINAELNKIPANRYRLIQSDVWQNITAKYDFILANPPYIPEGRKGELPKSVTVYEPHRALFSGPAGLDLCKQFLTTVKNRLQSGGQVWLEFDTSQKKELERLLPKLGYKNFEFHKDQYDRPRFVVISG